jgi:aryl-alcohol dehydrogenase-like predicted oxidoreductase
MLKNLALLPACEASARAIGCTPAHLALTCRLPRGENIISTPGTRSREYLCESPDAWDVTLTALTADQMARHDAPMNHRTVSGPRYNAPTTAKIDTDIF